MRRLALVLLASLAGAAGAEAQPKPDPDWPCVQRRVASIGSASVWSGPDLQAAGAWQEDGAAATLAHKLASRRTTLDEADALLDAFAAQAGPQRQERLTRLFAGVFALTNAERGRVLDGITRYARGQVRLAERIRDEADTISAAKDSPQAETPKNLAELETSFTWDKRIFEERSQALTYVCEVPALIEERLGEIARRIASRL
jgi:hypothetical protein